MTPESVTLRRRAALLRQLAVTLDSIGLDHVLPLAAGDTWLGPAADACRHELISACELLRRSADRTRVDAMWLDRRADEAAAVELLSAV